MACSEFELIKRYFHWPSNDESIAKGVGDDCALLNIQTLGTGGEQLAVSMDTLVAGTHFPDDATAAEIASRAFCTALSDLAAMGARPLWFTLGLTLPSTNEQWLQEFSVSLKTISQHYHCALIGGDTTRGPLAVTIQVHGAVNSPLQRSRATAGDQIFVTGTLGDGAAALRLLQNKMTAQAGDGEYLKQHFYRPKAQIAAGQLLSHYIHCAIDISDGLLADLQHIANASQVDMDIQVKQLPLSPAYKNTVGAAQWQLAASGGDDYQLAFTVPASQQVKIDHLITHQQLNASAIGWVRECSSDIPQVNCYDGERALDITTRGYQHFAS